MGILKEYKRLGKDGAIALVSCNGRFIWRYRTPFLNIDFAYKEFENFKAFRKFSKKLIKGI